MKTTKLLRRRIEEHGIGLGTASEETVQERAREIAITNGRRPEAFNQSDIDQARLELEGAEPGPVESTEEDESVMRDGPFGVSSGHAARTKSAPDEQAVAETLVEEGIEEATHERMVEGNRESRRRDEHFNDQLPPPVSLEVSGRL